MDLKMILQLFQKMTTMKMDINDATNLMKALRVDISDDVLEKVECVKPLLNGLIS